MPLSREQVLNFDGLYRARYNLLDDMASAAAHSARARGHLALNEFLAIATWKLASSGSTAFEQATEREVVEHSRAAFAAHQDDLTALHHLDQIRGIGFRAATAIMHITFPEHYPMLDQRAMRSLGLSQTQVDSLIADDANLRTYWPEYAQACRTLAKTLDVTLRQLDRALWWSDLTNPKSSPS
ncbi:MAG: hypothetical protein ACREJD_15125 [Phycisphaerales bacterium]